MRVQVKIFDDVVPDRLEDNINEFIKDKFLKDIKYTSSRASTDYDKEIVFSALVIYKEDTTHGKTD